MGPSFANQRGSSGAGIRKPAVNSPALQAFSCLVFSSSTSLSVFLFQLNRIIIPGSTLLRSLYPHLDRRIYTGKALPGMHAGNSGKAAHPPSPHASVGDKALKIIMSAQQFKSERFRCDARFPLALQPRFRFLTGSPS